VQYNNGVTSAQAMLRAKGARLDAQIELLRARETAKRER
jgi:hypothetical protein